MTNQDFIKLIEEELNYCQNLLLLKGNEYAPSLTRLEDFDLYEENDGQLSFCVSGKNDDRLRQFKKAAAITGETPAKALFGMLVKHLISLTEMCYTSDAFPVEVWQEKITDSINYLLLLYAIVIEEGKK